jgi:hypothetical protein
MGTNRIVFALTFFSLGVVASCADILLEDISDASVVLSSPADSVQTLNQNQSFSWETVPGAEQYRFTMESDNSLIVDTLIVNNIFSTQLTTGLYRWCVSALNAGYTATANCRILEIVEQDEVRVDISLNTISLLAPAAGLQTKNKQHLFLWDELEGATKYRLLVVSPDLVSPSTLTLDTVITSNFFTKQLAVGQYEWCVKGVNSEFSTAFNCRKLTVNE